MLRENNFTRTHHADAHFIVINDTTLTGGDIGYWGRSLAELGTIGGYWAENWEDRPMMDETRYDVGDVLSNDTSPARYVVANVTTPGTGYAVYTLYAVEPDGRDWLIPAYVDAGISLDAIQVWERAMHRMDHADPHFAVVTDSAVENGITYAGPSLGEILEGTPGYPARLAGADRRRPADGEGRGGGR